MLSVHQLERSKDRWKRAHELKYPESLAPGQKCITFGHLWSICFTLSQQWHGMGIYVAQELHIFPLSLETWCSNPLWDGQGSIIFSFNCTHAKKEHYTFAMLIHFITFSLQKSHHLLVYRNPHQHYQSQDGEINIWAIYKWGLHRSVLA